MDLGLYIMLLYHDKSLHCCPVIGCNCGHVNGKVVSPVKELLNVLTILYASFASCTLELVDLVGVVRALVVRALGVVRVLVVRVLGVVRAFGIRLLGLVRALVVRVLGVATTIVVREFNYSTPH